MYFENTINIIMSYKRIHLRDISWNNVHAIFFYLYVMTYLTYFYTPYVSLPIVLERTFRHIFVWLEYRSFILMFHKLFYQIETTNYVFRYGIWNNIEQIVKELWPNIMQSLKRICSYFKTVDGAKFVSRICCI